MVEVTMKVGNPVCERCLTAHPVTWDCSMLGFPAMQAEAVPVAWQRRQQYSDIPGYVPQWQFVSKEEATSHFEKRPGYEYRPLYAHREAAYEAGLKAGAEAERARVVALVRAAQDVAPYLAWTVGPESPGHHPTMPSAVAGFLGTLAAIERGEHLETDDGSNNL